MTKEELFKGRGRDGEGVMAAVEENLGRSPHVRYRRMRLSYCETPSLARMKMCMGFAALNPSYDRIH